jgi:hypothetical protein
VTTNITNSGITVKRRKARESLEAAKQHINFHLSSIFPSEKNNTSKYQTTS